MCAELSSKTLASIKGVLVMGPSGGGACGEAFRTLFPKLTSLAFVHTFAAGARTPARSGTSAGCVRLRCRAAVCAWPGAAMP